MAHVMEVDVAFDPVDVSLLGADGVVFCQWFVWLSLQLDILGTFFS